jgi:hypothetical protein
MVRLVASQRWRGGDEVEEDGEGWGMPQICVAVFVGHIFGVAWMILAMLMMTAEGVSRTVNEGNWCGRVRSEKSGWLGEMTDWKTEKRHKMDEEIISLGKIEITSHVTATANSKQQTLAPTINQPC